MNSPRNTPGGGPPLEPTGLTLEELFEPRQVQPEQPKQPKQPAGAGKATDRPHPNDGS